MPPTLSATKKSVANNFGWFFLVLPDIKGEKNAFGFLLKASIVYIQLKLNCPFCSWRCWQVGPDHPADPEPFCGRVRPHHRGQLQEAGRHRWRDVSPRHPGHRRTRGDHLVTIS